MKKRNLPKTRSSKVTRQRDPIPWKYCLLTLACGLLLVVGFFYAARSHFSSMDFAMKNAELRKQIDDLKSETRRLKLAREIAQSPAEIKLAAQKLGLTMMPARSIQITETRYVENKSDEKEKSKTAEKVNKKDGKETAKKSGKKEEKQKNKSENKKPEKKEDKENPRKDGSLKIQIAKK